MIFHANTGMLFAPRKEDDFWLDDCCNSEGHLLLHLKAEVKVFNGTLYLNVALYKN